MYYFWASDPSEYDVNRVAVIVKLGTFTVKQQQENAPSGRYHAPIGRSISNALRHDGRGPLVL